MTLTKPFTRALAAGALLAGLWSPVSAADISGAATICYKLVVASLFPRDDKVAAKERLAQDTARIAELQLKLYAESRRAVLVVLQGMDTSGKDGTIRNVFEAVNPVGLHVVHPLQDAEVERQSALRGLVGEVQRVFSALSGGGVRPGTLHPPTATQRERIERVRQSLAQLR